MKRALVGRIVAFGWLETLKEYEKRNSFFRKLSILEQSLKELTSIIKYDRSLTSKVIQIKTYDFWIIIMNKIDKLYSSNQTWTNLTFIKNRQNIITYKKDSYKILQNM